MKRSISFISIILIICLISVICTSCVFKDYATNETNNLFQKASITTLDGKKTSLGKKKLAGEGLIIQLNQQTKLNTIILGESNEGLKSNITNFTLFYLDKNNEWKDFYTQDLVEKYRYCVFDEITTNKIKLIVNSTQDNRKWNLKKFSGHYVTKTANQDFRVMGYAVAGFAYDGCKDPDIFNTITHINLFQHIFLNDDGTLFFSDKLHDKETIIGKDYFTQELNNIVQGIGDRDVKIILTILPKPGSDPETLHSSAFKDHSSTIINTINALYNEFPQIDGVAFDYEYPYSGKANNIFGDFVRELKLNMPDNKILALALSSWQFKPGLFPHKALEYVDMVEMMAYDQFDARGYHSTFQTSMVNIVEYLTTLGLKNYLSKINIGLPFYSRPTDGSAYWGDYNLDAEQIGKNNNIITNINREINKVVTWDPYVEKPLENPILYYNSPQMIFDKTAYAIDNKLGGMMIWHLGCDVKYSSENSLLKSIQKAIDLRS